MKKQIWFLMILILSITVFVSAAEDEDAYVEFNSALGFQVGAISGSGISYQTWFSETTGVQVAFGALYFPDGGSDGLIYSSDLLDYSLGGELQYRVYGEDYANWFSAQLYTFAGLNHSGDIASVYNSESDSYTYAPYQPHFTIGVGIGIEVIVFRHLSVPFEIGYALKWSPLAGEFPEQFNVDLVPQFAFRYRY